MFSNQPSWLRFTLKATGIVAGLLVLFALVLHFVVFPAHIESTGERMQSRLNSRASEAWGTFDNCVIQTARAAQVAEAQTDAVSQVLENAVSGRYGAGDELDRTRLFSQLQEAYPDLSGLDTTFRDAMTIMLGCQDDFLRAQGRMNNAANRFVEWQYGGWFERTYDAPNIFPNERLQVVVGRQVLASGSTALLWMQSVIVDVDTANSIERGLREGNASSDHNPFEPVQPTTAPTPVPSPSPTG